MDKYLPPCVENIIEKGTPDIQSCKASFSKRVAEPIRISWNSVRNGEVMWT